MVLALPLLFFMVGRIVKPVSRVIHALTDGSQSLRDNDFSVSVALDRNDELGELVGAHNALGGALREERQSLFQRELLLDTVIQSTDIALLLTNKGQRVVYSNAAARQLFNKGQAVNGHAFTDLVNASPAAFSETVARGRDGLFTLDEDEAQTWHFSKRVFTLNAQAHSLYLFKQLTHELNRQEVATWKKVIRLISHELNNSLAPISSLAHSGQKVLEKDANPERLLTIFSTIEDRAKHLKAFIESYAKFARLPTPIPKPIRWREFFAQLRESMDFSLDSEIPDLEGFADPAQLEQVMINLIKNAHESGSPPDQIRLSLNQHGNTQVIRLTDQGGGISDEVMKNALLPFFSTKSSGTGLGLPLCREIIEAHGGRLSIQNTADGSGLSIEISLDRPYTDT